MDSGQLQHQSSWPANTARKRPQPPPPTARETQPWTTTRCHRLLRPLKAHIAALRRDHTLESDAQGTESVAKIDTTGFSRATLQHTYSRRGRKARPCSMTAEPDRQSDRAQKLARKKTVHPGDIILPTPALRRARQQELSSPVQQPLLETRTNVDVRSKRAHDPCTLRNAKLASTLSALELEMFAFKGSVSPTRYSLYVSILRAFHTLLVTTVDPAATSGKGRSNKSLMAMCLRKVPGYIGELELLEEKQAEKDGTKSALRVSEASHSIYEAVEDMLPAGRGCPPLRIIARSHGVKMVKDALQGGLLEDCFSLLLIRLCTTLEACEEAEELITIIVDRPYPEPKGVNSTFHESRSLAPLKALSTFACTSRRPQFLLRCIANLLTPQQLSSKWLSTQEFASTWASLVKMFSVKGICDDGVSFAVTALKTLASEAKTAPFCLGPKTGGLSNLSQSTLISIIAAITIIPLLLHEVQDRSQNLVEQKHISAVSQRVEYAIFACIYELKRARKVRWILTVLRLAAHFASNVQASTLEIDISAIWNDLVEDCSSRDGKQAYDAAITLLCFMAQNCARGATGTPHHYLTRLCDRLDAASGVGNSASEKLRIDCAFFLAERTNDLRDLAFAEAFHTTRRAEPIVRRASAAMSRTGFRWDEGISEWVSETANVSKQPSQRASSDRNQPFTDMMRGDRGWRSPSLDDLGSSRDGEGFYDVPGIIRGRNGRQTRAAARASGYLRMRATEQRSLPRSKRRRGETSSSGSSGDYSFQSEDEDKDKSEENDGNMTNSYNTAALQRKKSGASMAHAVTATRTTTAIAENSPKRRRVSALKRFRPAREIMATTGLHASSDDELGL